MSNVILRNGWVVDNPKSSNDFIRATISQTDSLGRNIPVIVIANIKTGNFDIYPTKTFQIFYSTFPIPAAGLGTPLFRYDATTDKPIPTSSDTVSLRSLYGDSRGEAQLNNLISSVKRSIYDIAEINTGTDTIRNRNFEILKNKKGYISLSNTAQASASQPPQAGSGNPPPASNPTPAAGTPTEPQPPDQASQLQTIGLDIDTELQTKDFKVVKGVQFIKYPLNMDDKQDKIKFEAYSIKTDNTGGRTAIRGEGVTENSNQYNLKFEFEPLKFEKEDGPVYLPIQSPIGDQHSIDWTGSQLNALDAALYDLSHTLAEQNKDIAATLSKASQSGIEAMKEQKGRIRRFVAGLAANQNNILPRTDNVILNPNLELLFNSPTLRPFNFSFRLSGREKNESEAIKTIIRFFKANMAARKEKNNIFLRAPRVFKIQYLYGNGVPHPGLNLIKMCALTNMSVDYTPLGSYMTYNDGSMVSYNINLQFQELTPIYQDDYENFNYGGVDDGNPIKPNDSNLIGP